MLAVSSETALGRKPLAVVGVEAGKADGRVLEFKEEVLVAEDDESCS